MTRSFFPGVAFSGKILLYGSFYIDKSLIYFTTEKRVSVLEKSMAELVNFKLKNLFRCLRNQSP